MARDFAHKPREPEGSNIPRWVWYFTGAVTVGFIAFLIYLSQVEPQATGADAVRQQLNEALEQLPKPEVTEEPTESLADIKEKADALKQAFEFYELLENEEVSVDLPEASPSTPSNTPESTSRPVATDKTWIIQVASFAKIDDADRVRAQLILNGLPETAIEAVEVPNKGTFFRVMVGPYDHRPSLNKAQDILAELNYQPLVKTR